MRQIGIPIVRDEKRLVYKSEGALTFILFLINVLFIDYSNVTDLNTEVFEKERSNITSKGKGIYYQAHLYVTLKEKSQIEEGKIPLNRRACHLTMFIDALIESKIISQKIDNNKLFALMRTYE